MKDMLDKVLDASWSGEYEDTQDLIIEQVQTYGQLGELFTCLIQSIGGAGDVDDRAVAFVADLFEEYLAEVGPQPTADQLR